MTESVKESLVYRVRNIHSGCLRSHDHAQPVVRGAQVPRIAGLGERYNECHGRLEEREGILHTSGIARIRETILLDPATVLCDIVCTSGLRHQLFIPGDCNGCH